MGRPGAFTRRSRTGKYFKRDSGAPPSLCAEVSLRCAFSDVDAMAVVWHGRYAYYFEAAYAALTRQCGISYLDLYEAQLRAPIVQMHVDYFKPLVLEELFTVKARLVWSEGARMNMEYEVMKADGSCAACGYTVQMFTDASGSPAMIVPEPIARLRRRWQEGEFACLACG